MRAAVCILLLATIVAARSAPAAQPDTTAVDTLSSPVRVISMPSLASPPFAVVDKTTYLLRHTYSLDHYLQFEPGVVLSRRGPIGSDVRWSRWGVGRGRGIVVYDGIVLNDPQNDIAPLVHFPVSSFGRVAGVHAPVPGLLNGIEGTIRVDEIEAPGQRPRTVMELSKGTNDLRQRRLQFSSAEGPVGIDLSFDELLNNGYGFDARGLVGPGSFGFGETTSRHYSARIRGRFNDGDRYSVYFREFTSTSMGDLVSAANDERRGGHLASARIEHGRLGLRFFERGYKVTYPDSHTVNQTTAVYATWRLLQGPRYGLVADAGYEDIKSMQRVGGAQSNPTLEKTVASLEGVATLGRGTTGRAYGTGTSYRDYTTEWGAGLDLQHRRDRVGLGVGARRSFRMPNLGDLFLPAHTVGGRVFAGNESLDGEYSWEADAHIDVTAGPLTSVTRWTSIRVSDPIAPRATFSGGVTRIAPANTGGALLHVFEERIRVAGSFRGVEFSAEGAGVLTDGDRVGFFATSPRTRLHAAARVGGKMFEATSALFFGAD